MNTLSTNYIIDSLHNYTDFRNAVNQISTLPENSSLNISGLKGALNSYFIIEYLKKIYSERIQTVKYQGTSFSANNKEEFNKTKYERLLVIVPGEREGEILKSDLQTICPEANISVLPLWGTLYYKPAALNSVIFGKRAGFFSKMAFCDHSNNFSTAFDFHPEIYIVPFRALSTPVPPKNYIQSLSFNLKKGDSLDTIEVSEKLIKIGYTRVPRVQVRGEFSLRGEVLDIFLPESEMASRILFDFDRIENIRSFDIESQNTVSNIDNLLIYPMKEVIWNEDLISKLNELLSDSNNSISEDSFNAPAMPASDEASSQNIEDGKKTGHSTSAVHLAFTEQAKLFREHMLESLKQTGCAEGEELFYPALWDKEYSIFDYFSKELPVFYIDYSRIENSCEFTDRELNNTYRKARAELPVLPPQAINFSFSEILERHSTCINFCTIKSEERETQEESGTVEAPGATSTGAIPEVSRQSSWIEINAETSQSYFGNINYLKDEIKNLQNNGWSIFIFADNENQALRINEIFKEFTDVSDKKNLKPLVITGQSISEGFILPELKLKVIQENEIFGRKKYVPKTFRKVKSQVIDTFVEMNPGDYVVHVNYGIALFLGIERVHAMGNERDYIKLEYAGKEFLFVPIEQVNMLQRYIGNEGEAPKLDTIGSKSWENRKNKVQKAVEDIAQKLIELYSKRKSQSGFPFPKDTEWQTAFEASFPYEDTPDQISVTEEIKKDMEKPVPMDRLLCGDVGYGKTEIAMRAAFKAVMGGKQVAFLAPTTILAEQHYENCIERFKNFPVKIACLSRFVTPAEQKKVLKALTEGKIDILVGTHRIIQKDIIFKNLGLMIIDEEQRFGVKDKEKLKEMKTNIDSLAMSATPIPRTLHMSLLKIRDISLLTTPPQSRQSIETVIDAYSDDRVTKAIRREVERGGQVFYLHNRVESLNETRLKLERLMPEMSVEVAHGQMTSEQLDDIFRRFKMGGFHILVATTIIENGIDIPNVNTIIIDRADMYGVSQLYQLRGRVGRSDRKAYAYLLYPGNRSLSEIAMKRLQVISDFTELGSGFKIAMKDMEIRGAGNLLGRDQSGSICSVGFDMYMKKLNEAVLRLSQSKDFKPEHEVLLELEYTGFIPETYVKNPQTKMEIYKKIAAVLTTAELDGVYNELTDHFGPVPEEVLSLFALAQIRILCRKLNISKIKERNGVAQVEFARISDIDVNKLLRLITESGGTIRPDVSNPSILYLNTGKIGLKEKSEFIKEKLEKIV